LNVNQYGGDVEAGRILYTSRNSRSEGNGPRVNFGRDNIYNYGIQKEIVEKLLDAKDREIQLLKEDVRYLKEKTDQLLEAVGKND